VTSPPPEPPPERPTGPSVGPLALEAALLLDVVADRLESMKNTADDAPPAEGTSAGAGQRSDEHPAADEPRVAAADSTPARCPECGSVPGASCTGCPLCRFMALLRGERPEATAKLLDGALMIIRTLRSLVPDPPTTGGSGTPPADPPPPPSRRGGLERIDIL
jgi:hypothetical protein